ncbi:hypothetical protein [Bosea sp. (in: a-proteobacteria)]|uniref:hypothetical protein n=1 Tax=Bosea sp. (in: a-proteobacteria) TaxID=1871050 RepID=UPI00333EC537
MSSNRYPPQPAAMAKRLGHHLLLSLGVTLATALVATLPGLLSRGPSARSLARAPAAPPVMTEPALLQDGKIVDRLGKTAVAGHEMVAVNSPVLPAALAMPMSLEWPEAGEWTPPAQRVVVAVRAKPKTGEGAASSPPHRVAALPVRAAVTAGPLVILPPAAATALETARDDSGRDDAWGRLLSQPATQVVDAVSGAADSVQAAGSWGLSRAASLLPRW